MDITPQIRRRLLTLAFSFLTGMGISTFVATLLVSARLPVEYLTPVTLSGPLVGLLVGALLVHRDQATHSPSR